MLLAIVFNKMNIEPDRYKKLKSDITEVIKNNQGVDLIIYDNVYEVYEEVITVGTLFDQVSIVQKESIEESDIKEFKTAFSGIIEHMPSTGIVQIIDKSESLKGIIAKENLAFNNLKYHVVEKITKSTLTNIILGTKLGQVDTQFLKSVDIKEVLSNREELINKSKEEEVVIPIEDEVIPVEEEEIVAPIEEEPAEPLEEYEAVPVEDEPTEQVVSSVNNLEVDVLDDTEETEIPICETDNETIPTFEDFIDTTPENVIEAKSEEVVKSEDTDADDVSSTSEPEIKSESVDKKSKVKKDGFLSNIFSRKKNRVDSINESAAAINGKIKVLPVVEESPVIEPEVEVPEYVAPQEKYPEVSKIKRKRGTSIEKREYVEYSFMKQPQIICITGAGSHGKSTIASSIAATVATLGVRTALIDCDLKKRMQSYIFEYELEPDRQRRNGLPELIKNKGFSSPDFYTAQPYNNLDVIGGNYVSDDSIKDISPENLALISYGLMATHKLIVIDMPWEYIVKNPTVISNFHKIIYVTTADLFGIIDVDTNISLDTFPQTTVDSSGQKCNNMNYSSLVSKLNIILNKVTDAIGTVNNSYVPFNKNTFIPILSETLDDNSIDPIKNVSVIGEIPVIPGIGNILLFNTPAPYITGDTNNIGEVTDAIIKDILKQI